MSLRPAQVDVLVVGSGLPGWLAALELARAGRRTAVVDGVEGGEAPPAGLVPSGPALSYAAAAERWGREGARELWALQRSAHAALRELLGEWARPCGYRSAGGFLLAATRAEGAALAASEDMLREDGFAGEFLDGYMVEARFGVRGFAGAYWAEGEAELDSAALAEAAAGAARAAGAVFLDSPPGAARVFSREGVRAETLDGEVSAADAVLASAAGAPALVPYFAGRVERVERRGIRLDLAGADPVPSPARSCDGRAVWTATQTHLALEVLGGGDPAALAARHLPSLTGPASGAWSRPSGVSRDGLPWVGALPGLPVAAALSAADDLAFAPLLARWATSALLTGRDATPARLRAARAGPAGAPFGSPPDSAVG